MTRRILDTLLHINDTPHRTALAFGIGVWIAFFPLWGIHTVMALGIAFLFRLNRPAVVIGAWINNPWTMAPLYTAGTCLGCALFHLPPTGFHVAAGAHGLSFFRTVGEGLLPYLRPFIIGNLVLGILAGLLSYAIARTALTRRRFPGPQAA